MTTGRINQVSFSFFRSLKFAHGPAVDKFFTREMVKNAPCSKSRHLATAELVGDKTAIGFDRTAIGVDKRSVLAGLACLPGGSLLSLLGLNIEVWPFGCLEAGLCGRTV